MKAEEINRDFSEEYDYDILVLTHRDDLIGQFKKFVDEFNYANETKIVPKRAKGVSGG